MVKLLHQLYYESVIDKKLQDEKEKRNFKTKSELLREILKKRYNLCVVDGCVNEAYLHDYCFIHAKQLAKEIKINGG